MGDFSGMGVGGMKGIEALSELKNGKRIRCCSWTNPHWHFIYNSESGVRFSVQSEQFPRFPDNDPLTRWSGLHNQEIAEELLYDLLNEDWEVV